MDGLLVVGLLVLWIAAVPIAVGMKTYTCRSWRLLVVGLAMWVLTTIVGGVVWLIAVAYFRRTSPPMRPMTSIDPTPFGRSVPTEAKPTPASRAIAERSWEPYVGVWRILTADWASGFEPGDDLEVCLGADTLRITRLDPEAGDPSIEFPLGDVSVTGNSSEVTLVIKGQPFLTMDWWDGDGGERLLDAVRRSQRALAQATSSVATAGPVPAAEPVPDTDKVALDAVTEPVQDDRMPCPRCAESIKRAAKMCRFCQLDLTARGQQDGPPAQAPGKPPTLRSMHPGSAPADRRRAGRPGVRACRRSPASTPPVSR